MIQLPPLPRRFRHHVLFSYTSADKDYVHAVHSALPEEVKVFDYAEEGIWGEELVKALERRYKNEAPFCVVFISEAYLKSEWTTKELAIVRRVAKRKPGYMLPVLLDGTKVPELAKIAWLDKTLSPEQLAARIVAKIREPPPRPWWFYVSWQVKLATAAAIASVLLVLILYARPIINYFLPSRTSINFVNADEQAITVHVANTGPKSATIVGQRLKFGTLPIKDADLRIEKASATIAQGERDVELTVLTLEPKCDASGYRLNSAEIVPLLGTQKVTLEVDVQESDDAPGHPTRKPATIPAARLNSFVGKWVPALVSSQPNTPPC